MITYAYLILRDRNYTGYRHKMAMKEETRNGSTFARILRGRSGDPEGGPYVQLVLGVSEDRIVSADWETNGCPAAQMSACGLATFLKGRTLEQASRMDAESLLVLIGGLPEGKGYYAQLAIDALIQALSDPCSSRFGGTISC